jgi:trigger factor
MKISRKNLPKSIVELTIEEGKENIVRFRKQALENVRKKANIKWFRPGAKIPDEVIVKNYWEEHLNALTIEYAIDFLYQEALKKEKLFPVAQAVIKEVSSQDPLKIVVDIEVFPEIEIVAKYKAIKLKKTTVKVGKEEIEKALEDIQTRFTRFEKQDNKYKIKSWDRVTIDTLGKNEKWDILEATKMSKYPLVIGSNMLVPGFEDGLIGKKSGEEVELDITFPSDYHSTDFSGKKTVFTVTIHDVEASIKPEFTPEFIKDLRGKELDLAGFKDLIKQEIQETKENNARLEDEHKLIEELKKVTSIDIGEKMLANQIEKVFSEIKENLMRDQIKMSDYLESLKLSEEVYKETQVKPIAEKRLFWELVLHKLVELEKTEVSEQEITSEIEKIMARYENPEVKKRLTELYTPGTNYYEELKQRMKYKNLIDSFFE